MKFAAFIDISNLYYTIRNNADGKRLDYVRFVEYINTFGEGKITGYGTYLNNECKEFIAMLTKVGVVPKYKRPLYTGKGKYKASWAVGITVDVLEAAKNVELIILATGSGNYSPLIEKLQEDGKRVMVIGYDLARELRVTCDQCLMIPDSMLVGH